MKRFYLGIIVILSFIIYFNVSPYKIESNDESIKKGIYEFSQSVNNIEILETKDIDNRKFVLYEFKGTLGDAILIRGINGKYKVKYVGHGDNSPILDRIEETNKGKYALIKGKNEDLNISYINFTVESSEYSINVPQAKNFIIYTPVSKKIKFPGLGDLRLYDKNNKDITLKIFNKYRTNN